MEEMGIILVLLAITSCKGQTHALCEGGICHIPPNNFSYSRLVVQSDQTILLHEAKYTINSNGIIVINNVSNIIITGGESGSLIECSPQSAFGFYLKNATNVTLTGLTFRNCAFLKGFLLIETPRSVVLSRIYIEDSPGLSLIVNAFSLNTSPSLGEDINHNLRLTDCIISRSRGGSMKIIGTISLLLEGTVIANSSNGISSDGSVVTMKTVSIINCTSSSVEGGLLLVEEQLVMQNSSLDIRDQDFHIRKSEVLFVGGGPNSGVRVSGGKVFVADNSKVVLKHFDYQSESFAALHLYDSGIVLNNSTIILTENVGTVYSLIDSEMDMYNFSSIIVANNVVTDNIFGVIFHNTPWRMGPGSDCSVRNNVGFSIILHFMKASLSGPILVEKNNGTRNLIRPLIIVNSTVRFYNSLLVTSNSGSGGILADNSDLYFYDIAAFADNYAANGGALLLLTSVIYISFNATVFFTNNNAEFLGGAIYISKPRTAFLCSEIIAAIATCSIQLLEENPFNSCPLFSVTFNQNKAGIAGNAIYGGLTSACIPTNRDRLDICLYCKLPIASDIYQYNGVNDSSDLSSFTSDPTRVCFCVNGIPNCYKTVNTIEVYPGELFNLSLVIVGYGLGTVPGSVIARGNGGQGSVRDQSLLGSELEFSQEIRGIECQDVKYSIVSERESELISLAVNTNSFVRSVEEVQAIVDFELNRNLGTVSKTVFSPYHFVYEAFFNIPVFVEVNVLTCPVGFYLLRGRCVCHPILTHNNINTCSISNGMAFILRLAPYWIGLSNDTNSSILVHPHCPYDYCEMQDININAESSNAQCQYQRSGILCGSCHEGLSMILGSSECRTCSNIYLLSIIVFIFVGIVLVTLVTLANMTVSVGTLNGVIFVANILQANQRTFLPPGTSDISHIITFLSTFIAWLNLDLGIPMCFIDGLTTYVKTWLQFVFPLYILALVGAIITVSNYSTRVTNLLGINAVPVLATLILLSYTKILRTLITAFSFTTLTGSQNYYSVVWLPDGNIEYFELKHAILFLVALFVLLLLAIPYTLILFASPWIQGSRSKWVSSLYNKFKPMFDAYMGPYKDKYRFWTGMLLLVRVVLIVLFSSIANTNTVAGPQLNLLLLNFSSCGLLALTVALRPYKNKLLNGLEVLSIMILFIFSSCYLYTSTNDDGDASRAYIYVLLVGIILLVFLGICVGHIFYKIRNIWPRANAGFEERGNQAEHNDEQTEEVITLSTGQSSDNQRKDFACRYRDSALELANFN